MLAGGKAIPGVRRSSSGFDSGSPAPRNPATSVESSGFLIGAHFRTQSTLFLIFRMVRLRIIIIMVLVKLINNNYNEAYLKGIFVVNVNARCDATTKRINHAAVHLATPRPFILQGLARSLEDFYLEVKIICNE